MAGSGPSFHETIDILAHSKAPLSVRFDVEYKPTTDELELAHRTVNHVNEDSDVRSRLSSLQVEPLVRAAAILIEECRRARGGRGDAQAAESVAKYLSLLDLAFGAVPSVLNNRGVARHIAGDVSGADADFAAARRLAANFIAPRVNEIEILRHKGDFERLEKVADEILLADSKNVAALRAALDAKVAQKRSTQEVLGIARRLKSAKGSRPSDLFLLGCVALDAGAPAEAEGVLRELIEKEPRNIEARVRLATAFLEQGKFPEAVAANEKLKEIDGPKPEYTLAIAMIYDEMGRVEDALNAYVLALDNTPPRDLDVLHEALTEFKERRSLAGPVATLPEGEALPALKGPEPPLEPPVDRLAEEPTRPLGEEVHAKVPLQARVEPEPAPLEGDGSEPKTIGDDAIFTTAANQFPLAAPKSVSPSLAPSPPPETRPAPAALAADSLSPEESLAHALESGPSGIDAAEEILGEAEEEWPSRPSAAENKQGPGEVVFDAPVGPSEAIVPIEPAHEELALPPPHAEFFPRPAAPASQRAFERTRGPAPVVSSPPPPREEPPDPEVAAELEALSAASNGQEAEAAAETFRRPAFDVDQFMAALESKTKPTFDHLYDGMLEARRKQVDPGDKPADEPQSAYVSAPPVEGPAPAPPVLETPFIGAAGAESGSPEPAAAESAPPVPLLLKQAAAEAAGTAPSLSGPDGQGLLKEALDQARRGDDGVARATVERHLALFPDDAGGWNLRGDLLERAGKPDEALRSYWNAVKYDPQLKEAWNNIGVLLHLLGRFADSAAALESAVKVDPNDRHLWHNLGSTYHELGRLEDALRAFDRAIGADPKDKVSYNNRGTTLFELADYRGAAESFRRALALDANFEQANNNLGRALEKLGDREGAAACFEAALADNPVSLAALGNLARVLKDLGRISEAEDAQARLGALGAKK